MSRSPVRAGNKKNRPLWQESILLVAAALVIAVVVKAFFLQAFYIPSGSMEPTMQENDKILVQKVSLWFGDVHRGDIVVFDDPAAWLGDEGSDQNANFAQRALEKVGLYPSGGHLIKRVVGVGGDTVVCCTDGKLTVNGVTIDEPYLLDEKATADVPFEVKVRKGNLWVMGDNRGNSGDSRLHTDDPHGGQVPADAVVGKAWVRVWPLGRAGIVHGTSSFDDVKTP